LEEHVSHWFFSQYLEKLNSPIAIKMEIALAFIDGELNISTMNFNG
jgi:hypothetical protein